MHAGLHGVLLGWQTKRIPTHGVKNIEALHALGARGNVGADVSNWMPDVQARARRIGKHIEHIKFWFGRVKAGVAWIARDERTALLPPCLPLALNSIGEGGVISKWGFQLGHEWRSLQSLKVHGADQHAPIIAWRVLIGARTCQSQSNMFTLKYVSPSTRARELAVCGSHLVEHA